MVEYQPCCFWTMKHTAQHNMIWHILYRWVWPCCDRNTLRPFTHPLGVTNDLCWFLNFCLSRPSILLCSAIKCLALSLWVLANRKVRDFSPSCSAVSNQAVLCVYVGAASSETVRGFRESRGQNHRDHHRQASGPPTRLGENSNSLSICLSCRWQRLLLVGLTFDSHSWWHQKKMTRSTQTCWYIKFIICTETHTRLSLSVCMCVQWCSVCVSEYCHLTRVQLPIWCFLSCVNESYRNYWMSNGYPIILIWKFLMEWYFISFLL